MRKLIFYISFLSFVFISCTKEVNVNLPETDPQLVIEGWIEQGKYPIVYLTKSKKYTDKIDSSNFLNYIASVAKVTVSNNYNSEVLTLKLNQNQFPFYYYEGTEILGEIGDTYTIKVELSGKTYEGSTTILPSVSLTKYEFQPVENDTTKKFINIQFQDPPEVKNYYRVYIKRLNKDHSYKPCYLSTINDVGFNGESFSYQIVRNYSSSLQEDDTRYFVQGDSVMVKFCAIDQKTHDYWKTIDGLIAVSANPFGLSTNTPLSNFTNDALGIFYGLSSKNYLIVIK